jgi:hypothetical protein
MAPPPDYLTLDRALETGAVEVTEVDKGGSVPHIRLVNRSGHKVLVVDGEELVGAKQNRIVNATFLIGAHCEVILPVSCVEAGRWRYRTPHFASEQRIVPSFIRREHQETVTESLSRGEGYRSDQGIIWDRIRERLRAHDVASASQAVSDLFRARRSSLEDYTRAFRLMDHQAGAVFALGGKVMGVELFAHPDVFCRFFRRLVESYALDALELEGEEHVRSVPPAAAGRFMDSIPRARAVSYPSLGLGENIRFEGRTVVGSALVVDGGVLHLAAFRRETGGETRGRVRMERPSSRRRRV